jgi:hypothetical protein
VATVTLPVTVNTNGRNGEMGAKKKAPVNTASYNDVWQHLGELNSSDTERRQRGCMKEYKYYVWT